MYLGSMTVIARHMLTLLLCSTLGSLFHLHNKTGFPFGESRAPWIRRKSLYDGEDAQTF